MDQNRLHETFVSESIDNMDNGFNNYSNDLEDVIQTKRSFPNNNQDYNSVNHSNSCANCLGLAATSTVPDHNEQKSMSNNDQIPSAQYSSSHSTSMQQCVYNNANTQQVLHVNSPSNSHTELFKIEISGIEIIVRQKSLPNENYLEMQNRRSQQLQPQLINRTGRIQNRMHPYHKLSDQNKINNRDQVSVNSSHHSCSHTCSAMTSQLNQQNLISNVSNVNRTSDESSLNAINMQSTLINQSVITDNPQNLPQFQQQN